MKRKYKQLEGDFINLVRDTTISSAERLRQIIEEKCPSNEDNFHAFSLIDKLLVNSGYVSRKIEQGGCMEECQGILSPTPKGIEFYNKYLKK